MKTTKLCLILLITTALVALAQDPAPSATPTATPAATPASVLTAIIAPPAPQPTPTYNQSVNRFRQMIARLSKRTFDELATNYLAIMKALTTDDSATGGLTVAQKQAALNDSDKSVLEEYTAWQIANLLNGIHPGAVPNPSASPAPSPSPTPATPATP